MIPGASMGLLMGARGPMMSSPGPTLVRSLIGGIVWPVVTRPLRLILGRRGAPFEWGHRSPYRSVGTACWWSLLGGGSTRWSAVGWRAARAFVILSGASRTSLCRGKSYV